MRNETIQLLELLLTVSPPTGVFEMSWPELYNGCENPIDARRAMKELKDNGIVEYINGVVFLLETMEIYAMNELR